MMHMKQILLTVDARVTLPQVAEALAAKALLGTLYPPEYLREVEPQGSFNVGDPVAFIADRNRAGEVTEVREGEKGTTYYVRFPDPYMRGYSHSTWVEVNAAEILHVAPAEKTPVTLAEAWELGGRAGHRWGRGFTPQPVNPYEKPLTDAELDAACPPVPGHYPTEVEKVLAGAILAMHGHRGLSGLDIGRLQAIQQGAPLTLETTDHEAANA